MVKARLKKKKERKSERERKREGERQRERGVNIGFESYMRFCSVAVEKNRSRCNVTMFAV